LFASNGILFNHESERRGKTFVTRKITVATSKIICGLQEMLYLGNLDSKRDWGYAPEYVEGMWRILQTDKPDDFVLATNETHSIREFVEATFSLFGLQIEWDGNGVDEVGKISQVEKISSTDLSNEEKELVRKFYLNNRGVTVVSIDPRYFRPTEVDLLIGDYSKAKGILGWEPKTSFEGLVRLMTRSDYNKIKSRIS
jgi:GDPmannose 4,6-dehydratase